MHKVKWHKVNEDTPVQVWVNEGKGWVPYYQSKCYKPDINQPGHSKGFPTFQNCLKHGYQVLGVDDSLI